MAQRRWKVLPGGRIKRWKASAGGCQWLAVYHHVGSGTCTTGESAGDREPPSSAGSVSQGRTCILGRLPGIGSAIDTGCGRTYIG